MSLLSTTGAANEMKSKLRLGPSTQVWIPIGAVLFIIALTVSAIVVPQLRALHFLQALIYVAIIILAQRNNVWAFGAGAVIAIAWNSLQLFVTHLVQAGAVAFWHFLHTGQVRRLDTMMVPLGCIGHFVMLFGCLIAFRSSTTNNKWLKFAAGGGIVLAYFILIVTLALPR